MIELTEGDKQADSPEFYWVTKGSGKKVSAFRRIRGVEINDEKAVPVYAPEAISWDQWVGTHYKGYKENNTNPWLFFSQTEFGYNIVWPKRKDGSSFSGENGWFQLASCLWIETYSGILGGTRRYAALDLRLDKAAPYEHRASFKNNIAALNNSLRDVPGSEILPQLTRLYRGDSFTTYCMVRPSGGIWVPVGKIVTWGYAFNLTVTGAVWNIEKIYSDTPTPESDSSFPTWNRTALPTVEDWNWD